MFLDNLKKGQKIHMIGIGGISMSGLAEILTKWGYKVSGSDLKSSDITEKLKKSGIEIFVPHDSQNIDGANAVVYTAAVTEDNPELIRAKQLGLPIADRATLLGEITKIYPKTIAISGTHGKTTTTSMISVVFEEANTNPTILVGGVVDAIGGNYRIGNSEFLVTEACEYVESFLKFYPHTAVILNIEEDHLDYFRDIDHIKSAFEKFANRVPVHGLLVGNFDDENIREIFSNANHNYISFGLKYEKADWRAEIISTNTQGCAKFVAVHRNQRVGTIQLNVPGVHNVYNALACIASASFHGIDFDIIKSALQKFIGARRRFEYKGSYNGITIVDDYAHHPSEVQATLEAASHHSHNSLWCVFQPHTYTRTKALLNEFATAFKAADKVVIIDIYAAREANTGQIHSTDLVNAINKQTDNAIYAESFDQAAEILQNQANSGDLIITMGAGDVYKIGETILQSKKAAV